jgi:putative membrane protein
MYGGYVWGMHWLGWILWLLVIVLVAVVLIRVIPGRSDNRPLEPTALEILSRRYAAGEISTAEYDERKAKLEGRG